MSVTIVSKNKSAKWMPNSAGWDLCGFINSISGAVIYLSNGETDYPRPPDNLTAKQAESTANIIEFMLFKNNTAVGRMAELKKRTKGLFDGDLEAIVKDYVKWLRTCRGYRLVF